MERTQAVFRVKSWYAAPVMLAMLAACTDHMQSPPVNVKISTVERLVFDLQSNVVRIVVHPGAGAPVREGFGFVVGEDAGRLYIVTADHVVRGEEGPDIDKNPTVIFFHDQKEYASELLGSRLPKG